MRRGAIEGSVRVARSTLERSFDRWIKVTMKIVVSAILVIGIVSGTEANASTESCTPGERMMKDCNTCFCIDGSRYVCTTMACVTGLTCRPGKSFKHYCNVCRCSGNGLAQAAACTKNVCVEGMFKEDGTLNGPLSGSILREKRQANPTDGTCEPGQPFKHYCNNCRCGNDGLVKSAACTKMLCAEGVFNEDGSLRQPLSDPTPRDKRQADGADATCVPGTSYNYYCNTCRCGTDGLRKSAMCTRAECPESMWNEDGSLKEPQSDPTPRDKRQTDGADATCVPGTSYNYYCNTCRCGTDGLRKSAMCTRAECAESMWNEDGSLKEPQSDPTPRDKRQADGADATCVPGTSYNYFCNTCRCGTDGLRKSAMCTRAECPESMWNEDGSLKQPQSDPTPRDKRQADGAGATCVPGTSFKWYCNTCLCGDDGLRKSAACTEIGCPVGAYNEDGTVKQPLTVRVPRDKRQSDGADATCVPGTSYNYYCNTCRCGADGLRKSAMCTRAECPESMWNEDGSLKEPQSDPTPRDKRQADGAGATCVPGTSFKWYCNTCLCGDDGLRKSAGCTRIGCQEGVFNEDGTVKHPLTDPIPRDKRQANGPGATCVPGTSFKLYCNTCYCPDSGRRDAAACTLMGCPAGMWNKDGSLKAPLSDPIPRDKRQTDGPGATCVPGTSFKLYCNTCYCPDSGRRDAAACTLMGCPAGMWNKDGSLKAPLSDPIPRDKRQTDGAGATCVPGTSFKLYCNTCYCPDSGLREAAACTLMGCPAGMWNKDGSLKAPLSDPIPRDKRQTDGAGATCVPGTSFKLYCNTCYCPDSGRRDAAACTLMGCPAGMWNKDGSLKAPLSDPIPRDKRQTDGAGATCVPGTSFKLYCNTCYCPDSGLRDSAACRSLGCPAGVWNEDGSLKAPSTDPISSGKRQTAVAGATCVPETTFEWYFVTCRCGEDGLRNSAACTTLRLS